MMPSGSGLVTVFGGSGFVGTQVVRALARRGLRIRVAVRNPNLAHDLKPLGDVGQVMPIYGDITDPATVKSAVAGADIVINLVGILYERPGSKAFEHIHVEGARTVAEAAREAGARHFVQMSAIGADADIAIVDMQRSGILSENQLHSTSKISPWHGRPIKGYPLHTLVRGKFVMRNGELVTEAAGWGRSVKDIQQMPTPRPQNTEHYTDAILSTPEGVRPTAEPRR